MASSSTEELGSCKSPFTKGQRFDLAPTQADDADRPSDVWRRSKRLGKGSFGIVYLEERGQGSARETRAVKKIEKDDPYVAKEHLALTRFGDARYEEFFGAFKGCYEDQEYIYFAMEYFELGDLAAQLQLRGSALPEPDACDVVQQICEGLRMMHDSGFTHRDLKPNNIFVLQCQPRWRVKIGDFGVSKHVRDGTELRTAVGTRLYSAPEILHMLDEDYDEGQSSSYTNAVDMWSLGVIAFEILCGQRPFLNDRDIRAYCSGELEPLPKKMKEKKLDSNTIKMTSALLTISPGERPKSEDACLNWGCHTRGLQAALSDGNPHLHTPRAQDGLQNLNSSFPSLSTQDVDETSIIRAISNESTIRQKLLRRFPPAATSNQQAMIRVPDRRVTKTQDRDAVQQLVYPSELEPGQKCTNRTECVPTSTIRRWADRSGSFEWEGNFVGIKDGRLMLQTAKGSLARIPLDMMSIEDIRYIEHTANIDLDAFYVLQKPREFLPTYETPLQPNTSATQESKAMANTDHLSSANPSARHRTSGKTFRDHSYQVTSVSISKDAMLLASGFLDSKIKIWNTTSAGAPLHMLKGHSSQVSSVTFSREGERLASASGSEPYDRKSGPSYNCICIWNVTSGDLVNRLESPSAPIRSMAFSWNGSLLVSGCTTDNAVKIWDATTELPIHTLEGHSTDVWAVALSGDGELLASGSSDGTVKIWKVASGALVQTLGDYSDTVLALALSWDGKLLASASFHSTIQIWDTTTGAQLTGIQSPLGMIQSAALARDGELLACGYVDGTIVTWDAITGA